MSTRWAGLWPATWSIIFECILQYRRPPRTIHNLRLSWKLRLLGPGKLNKLGVNTLVDELLHHCWVEGIEWLKRARNWYSNHVLANVKGVAVLHRLDWQLIRCPETSKSKAAVCEAIMGMPLVQQISKVFL